MTVQKMYHWLRLKDDFFRDIKIKKLRKIDDTDNYVVIYQKILLLSIKNESVLVYEGLENTFEEEIALKIDEKEEKVKATIEFLLKYGLLISKNKNEYYLPEAYFLTGKEGEGAERMRKFRENEKLQGNKNKSSKKAPLTNAQRQKRFKAKKICEEQGHILMIKDDVNRNKYNGCYYLVIKRDEFKCAVCGDKHNLSVNVLNEDCEIITDYDNKSIDEYNMISLCEECYKDVSLGKKILQNILNSIGVVVNNEIIKNEKRETTEIEIDKQKDKEIDKDIYKNIKENEYVSNNKCVDENLSKIIKLYEANIGAIYPARRDWFIEVAEIIEPELFKKAIDICIDRCNVTPSYLKGIIQKWTSNNIHTLQDLQEKEIEYQNRNSYMKNRSMTNDSKKSFNINQVIEKEEIDPALLAELEELERSIGIK